MPQKRTSNQQKLQQRLADAALLLAPKKGWDNLTLADISHRANIPESVAKKLFSNTWDVLGWVLKKLEKDGHALVKSHLGQDWKDNLLDIILTRLELAQDKKAAYTAILPALIKHPKIMTRFGKNFYGSARNMLALAKTPAAFQKPLHATVFAGLYLAILRTWEKDKTENMSKTMAETDKLLGAFRTYSENIACPE